MAGLDLSGVAEVLQEWIVDLVQIVRDNGTEDDTLDEESGELVPAPTLLLYEDVGLVQPFGEGYRLLLPLGSNMPLIAGDQVHVAQARGFTTDAQLVTRQFQVADRPEVTSLSVAEIVPLDETGWVEGMFPAPGTQIPIHPPIGGQGLVEDPDNPGFYLLED